MRVVWCGVSGCGCGCGCTHGNGDHRVDELNYLGSVVLRTIDGSGSLPLYRVLCMYVFCVPEDVCPLYDSMYS